MKVFVETMAVVCAGVAFLAAAYVTLFAAMGIRARRRSQNRDRVADRQPTARVVVVIPAHNEEGSVGQTVLSLLACPYPEHLRRVLVIADNCTDQTAADARQAGAEVWERYDLQQRGKGYALAWAMERIEATEFDLVTVVDADSIVSGRYLRRLAETYEDAVRQGQREIALQARYEFSWDAAASGKESWFNWFTAASKAAENTFIYLPRSEFGLMTLLQGNGLTVSREALRKAPLRAYSITEDAEYAITLAFEQIPVRFVEDAVVVSRMTAKVADAAPQRLRWASGMWHLLGNAGPRMIKAAVRRRDWRLAEGAVALLFTSRIALCYITALAFLPLFILGRHEIYSVAGTLLLATVALQALYMWLVLRNSGGPAVPLRVVLLAPAYLAIVVVIQGGAALGLHRNRWHRTVR